MSERVILVVDDEPAQRTVLGGFLRKRGFEVAQGASVEEALAHVSARTIDLVLTDLRMPGGGGLALLEGVRAINPEIPVVVMTAFGTVATAVDAMKKGAADYLTKPIDLDELEVLIGRTLERRALVAENRELRRELETRYRLAGLETANAKMSEAINTAARAAASRATILIRGESGTGKELLARAIHQASPRSRGPLVSVNVAALPETLLESELFGHEKGAFTGAIGRKEGRFELADGGTLFLDEIGDISPTLQIKLLRVLQQKEFERVGGTQTLKVDVRLVAATNRDLAAEVKAGKFREDLFYRLNVVALTLPPLRQRKGDIPALVAHFIDKYAKAYGKEIRGLAPGTLNALLSHDWPGNVRELENVVERAVVLCKATDLTADDLPPTLRGPRPRERTPGALIPGATLYEIEREAILRTLEMVGGSTSRAAEILGISVRKIQYRLKEYASGAPEGPIPHDEDGGKAEPAE